MIWLILPLALILRLIVLNQSLWLDEAINVLAAKNLSFWDFIIKYPIGDFHPPGFFMILWIWTRFFGFSEMAVRFPSVFFGVLSVFIIYKIGKELFNKKIALLGAFLLTIAPLHIYYSQEARMYSLSVLITSLSFYFFYKFLKSHKNIDLFFYIFFTSALAYTEYVAYLIIPAQFFFVLFFQKENIKKIFLALLLVCLLLLPWLIFVFPTQFETGRQAANFIPGWNKVVGGANIKEIVLIFVKTVIGRVSLDNKTIYLLLTLFLALIYSIIFAFSLKKIDKQTKLLLLWIVFPLTSAFFISLYIPIFSYFRMIFILPAFYLLVAKGILSMPKKFIYYATTVVTLISLVCLFLYFSNPKFQREDWRGASNFISSQESDKSVVLFEDNNIPAPFQYYYQGMNVYPGLKKTPAKTVVDLVDLNFFSEKQKIYLFEYLVDINDPQKILVQKLEVSGWKRKQIFNFNGVGFIYLYEKV